MNYSIKSKLRLLVCFACAMVAALSIICVGEQVYAAPCDHSYSTTYVEPTCDSDGYTEYVCSACGYSYREPVYSTGHNMVFVAPIDPTCDTAGCTVGINCSRCGYIVMESVYLPPLGHQYQVETFSPTCTEMGYSLFTCTSCGYSYQDDLSAPFGHEYHRAPSDVESDTVIYSCLMCGYTYTETVEPEPPHVHGYRTEVTEASCTDDGYITHICDGCGDSYTTDHVDAYGHKFKGGAGCVRCGAPFVLATVADGYCGGVGDGTNLTWKLTNDGVLTVSGKGAMKSFRANAPWKVYKDQIKSVIISNGVTTVGYDAFDDCSELRSVVIGNNVITVEDFAFGRCEKLTSVTVGYSVEEIGALAFCYCPGILEVVNYSILTLNAGDDNYGELCANALEVHYTRSKLEGKGEFWFYTYKGVCYLIGYDGTDTEITLPADFNGMTYEIYSYAFSGNNTVESVDIGNGVTKIGVGAFSDCKALSSIILGEGLFEIGENAFASCTSLTNAVFAVNDGWTCSNTVGKILIDHNRLGNKSEAAYELVYGYSSRTWKHDHSHAYRKTVVAPTCVSDGYTNNYCSECGHSTVSDPVSALGHTKGNTVVEGAIEAGCEREGRYDNAFYCTACHIELSRDTVVVPATGHAYDNEYDADCNNCGEVREVEIPVTVVAEGKCGVNATWVLTSDGVLTVSGEGAMSDYSTTVSAPWYSHSMSIKTVVIEEGITHVGEYAFRSCTAMTSLDIAEGVLTIGYYAFNQCSMLTRVVIPDSVTFIDSYAFANCHNLTDLIIGNGVEIIGNYAFRYCGKLTAVVIPATVKSIRYGAFYRCSVLTSVTFETTDGWIYASNADATEGTELLPSDLADTVTAAKYLTSTYYNRYWIRVEKVEEPITVVDSGSCGVNTTWTLTSDGVLTISGNGDTEDYLVSITKDQPYRAYQDQITKVVFENGVTSIGRGAFYGFTNITEVVFPESLIAIHEYAFFGCTGIKSVSIPANTFYIGMYAFRKTGLTSISFANANGWKFADGTALDVTNVKAFTTENTYKQTCMRPVSENGTVIASGVFGNKDQFTWTLSSTGVLTVSGKGNMPKFNVNTTPWYGYRGAIRSVVIEEGITSVGRCAFHTCRAITNITLPESLETIAEYAFYNCQFLGAAAIPANVTRIEIFAFRKCYQLKDVTFALNYGWTAGDEKVSATELTVNAADMLTLVNYTKIWTRDVNAEEEVLDPNYVTGGACNTTVKWALTYVDDTKTKMKLTVSGTGAMPEYGTGKAPWYGYLDNIVEIEVGEGITEIGRCAFYGLKFVRKATIASTVTAIGDYGFYMCYLLKSIELPESVTYIAETAFTKTGLATVPTV